MFGRFVVGFKTGADLRGFRAPLELPGLPGLISQGSAPDLNCDKMSNFAKLILV